MSKKPLISALILALFAFHTVEVPFDLIQRSARPNHCCCQSIQCQCKHSKGTFCPMQHAPKHPHAHHEHRVSQASKIQKAAESSSTVWFTPAGCGSHEQKATNPAYSKDFYFQTDFLLPFTDPSLGLFSSSLQQISSFFTQGIDRPPRLSAFSF